MGRQDPSGKQEHPGLLVLLEQVDLLVSREQPEPQDELVLLVVPDQLEQLECQVRPYVSKSVLSSFYLVSK